MSRTEFNDMVDRFGGDIAFLGTGREKPATPKYRLALAIHRLAHGHEVKSIAALFGMSAETVEKWTDNSLIAVIRMLVEYVGWPSELDKDTIKRTHLSLYGNPDCLGLLMEPISTLIKLPQESVPRRTTAANSATDSMLSFAASSDQRVQRSMQLQTHTHMYFDGLGHIMGDAGFTCTPHIIPMYRRLRNEPQLVGRPVFLNHHVQLAHVRVEYAIGIKMRWTSLRNLLIRLTTEIAEARAYAFMQAAVILHNLLISTYLSVMSN
ncbi:uncharacterized protein L203_104790 [Cryptococcus depauperatus CBS 7841]|uniref:DDE Tnp4 domain-containing protein n=1 Tax=Cryptococcus depauperatus CBS 7841 TaxID=1295531 RepID=A0AAJ8JW82_9TREE